MLEAADVQRVLARWWSLDLEVIEALAGGARNEAFLVRSAGGRYVVKQTARLPESLCWEADLLVDLAALGFRVPVYELSRDGMPFVDGLVVYELIEGRPLRDAHEQAKLASALVELHEATRGYRQRPGSVSSRDLLTRLTGGDVRLDLMAKDDVAIIRRALGAVQDAGTCVVHGDPNPGNVRVAPDGRIVVLDWDEARVDVPCFDLVALREGVQTELEPCAGWGAVREAGLAWEAATSWTAEPDYAQRVLERLRKSSGPPVQD